MSGTKKLSNKFVFWYHINEISYDQEYENQIKKLAEFETLEDFWSIFQYLKKPDDCKQAIEFQLFKSPIKPMWEDENNKDGGRIALKLRKEFTNLVWEELIFAFIGGYFDKEVKDEINGLVQYNEPAACRRRCLSSGCPSCHRRRDLSALPYH